MSNTFTDRRTFLQTLGLGGAVGSMLPQRSSAQNVIQGFERNEEVASSKGWQPVSDQKIKVGIIGYGYCKFGAEFGFQNHPNVEVIAVSDLIPERCAALAKACGISKTYPSLEELVKDDAIEAVFIATDAPQHAKHSLLALQHGKHVACAVPAVYATLDEADLLFDTVIKTGLKYMLFETSMFRPDLWAMRQLYQSGHLGKLVYTEGEYYHYSATPIPSYQNWRVGLPPQFYPTHSTAYHLGVNDGYFTEVSCMGMPSVLPHFQPEKNDYKNPFGTEIALFRSHDGGMSRMAVSWDTPGDHGERGQIRGQLGTYYGEFKGLNKKNLPDLLQPPLPPGIPAGGHGGSHGRLTDEFVSCILSNRKPLVDVALALNLSVCGIIAHQSALKDGERLKIPFYQMKSSS